MMRLKIFKIFKVFNETGSLFRNTFVKLLQFFPIYCYSFDTIANIWLTIDVPFTDLIPVFRAKTVTDAGKFDSSTVYSLQMMLSKFEYDGGLNPTFKAGAFSLEIESIKAYGKENSPKLILMGDLDLWNTDNTKSNLLTIYAQKQEDLDF